MGFVIDEDIINKVKESTDIVDLISDYVDLKVSGDNYQGLCPFHNEKTPSFSVNRSQQFFHCFGCGKGGDVFNFLMDIEGLEFIESVKFLADRNGIELREKTEEDLKVDREKEEVFKINQLAARFFFKNLSKNIRAQKYLSSRKIDKDLVFKFGLGYAEDSWDSLLKHMQAKGFSEKQLEKAGLIGLRRDQTGYYDKFRDRIIFPIIDGNNKVLGFGGRVLGDKMPKYLNSQDTLVFNKGYTLYGMNLIENKKRADELILVEGYMDVIALYLYGVRNVLAGLGTAFTKNQAELLKKHGKEIYLCYDSDNAGRKATAKTLNILKSINVDSRVILLPEGYDPDDYISKYGLKSFNSLKASSLSYIDYYIYMYKKDYNLKNYDEKLEFLKQITQVIKSNGGPVEKEIYAEKVSKQTGISKESILAEVYNKSYRLEKNEKLITQVRKDKSKLNPAYKEGENILIYLSLKNKENYMYIYKNLSNNSLITDYINEVFIDIGKYYEKINKLDLLDEIDYMVDEKLKKKLLKFTTIKESEMDNLINLINFTKLKLKRDGISTKIKLAEEEKDFSKLKDLCLELIALDRKIKAIEEEGVVGK